MFQGQETVAPMFPSGGAHESVLSKPIEDANEGIGSNALQQEPEDMSTANTMAFRPLFAYRRKMEQRYKIPRRRYDEHYPRGRWIYVYT
nr:unnamed protein product [Callosobruchus analis]